MQVFADGFFHALQQEPHDDALRLVYADFLEEHGDEAAASRAELIRVQVELATLAPLSRWSTERTALLTDRQNELLNQWEHVWLGDWADVLDGWAFRRGFVEAIAADTAVFLDHAEEWFAQWPTLTVAKLTRAAGHLDELASSPWLGHLHGLDLSDNDITGDALASLTHSRFVSQLQALDLSGNRIGPRGAESLVLSRATEELSELHLGRCELGNSGLAALLGGGRSWRRLDLSVNWLCRRDLVRLVDSPTMRTLEALDLAGNPFGDNGASVLADSTNVGGLVDLGLCDTGTGNVEVAALAGSRNLKSLHSLDLRGHHCWPRLDRQNVDRGGIGELSRSPLLGHLRRLLLSSPGPSNGWVDGVLRIARPERRVKVVPERWMSDVLRQSRHLIPSQLTECDVEELWWLGDVPRRERLPDMWDYATGPLD